jgi:DNA-binding NarL/FixJ family response regulator
MVTINLLIVDDHALFLSGLSLVLQAGLGDVRIKEASCLEQALRGHNEPPALVLLDIQLPGIDGIEGLRLLKNCWPQVPVIMLSSVTDPDIVSQALSGGAAAFVSKADTSKKIIQVICQTLGLPAPQPQPQPVDTELQNTYHKPRLTQRQGEVLGLLCEGLSNKVVARRMNLSEFTVRGHVQAIFALMHVNSRSQALVVAQRCGLVSVGLTEPAPLRAW